MAKTVPHRIDNQLPLSTICDAFGHTIERFRENKLVITNTNGKPLTDHAEAKATADWYWLHVGKRGNDPQPAAQVSANHD